MQNIILFECLVQVTSLAFSPKRETNKSRLVCKQGQERNHKKVLQHGSMCSMRGQSLAEKNDFRGHSG